MNTLTIIATLIFKGTESDNNVKFNPPNGLKKNPHNFMCKSTLPFRVKTDPNTKGVTI